MNFAAAADELRRQEIARLAGHVTPTLEALLSLTPAPLRAQIALMMERLGHAVHSDPTAPELVTTKGGRKIVTVCAAPAILTPTVTRDLRRLHEAVLRLNASDGIFISLRGFTPDAEEFAKAMPGIRLVDGELLMLSMRRSMKGVTMPPTYKTMCRQCGSIVAHRLSKGEAAPCRSGHMVAPSIDRTALVRRKFPLTSASDKTPKPMHRPLSRREIRAHNAKYEARMMRHHQRGG
jgi:hypothetical protein